MWRRTTGAAALIAATTMVTACVPPGIACPAIGFAYTAPVELEIDPDLVSDGTVAACLPAGCEPVVVPADGNGRWLVPQEPPYTGEEAIGLEPGNEVRVLITDNAGTIMKDGLWEIPYTPTSDGFCPGPVNFHPVEIT